MSIIPKKKRPAGALRQVQTSLNEETATVRQHQWASAYQQAQADLKDSSAVVWLPDKIADVIRQVRPTPETTPAQTRRQNLKLLLLVLFLHIPAAFSYLLAYQLSPRMIAQRRVKHPSDQPPGGSFCMTTRSSNTRAESIPPRMSSTS